MLIVQNNNQPAVTIIDPRGLRVTAAAHLMSGFTVYTGEREIGNIRVEEGIAQGIGVTYLSSLRIVNVADNQILWEDSFRDVIYNCERVRRMVGAKLKEVFIATLKRQNMQIPVEQIDERVNESLNKAYYEQTDKTVLKILTEWGIEIKPA
ncbi:hypothetical protein [Rhodoflexus caldus]|uniref:hypothetical protein n=1 Tax=Rhodoflexus caldus TaxID=2891236 RepID=UPI002029DE8E|nr:hypothetical protein [Rhodoflexus caldus]